MAHLGPQPEQISFSLPAWLAVLLAHAGDTPDIQQRMSLVISAARGNVEAATGGPFAAGIFERDSGQLVSLGVNLVTTQGLSMLHAEMVAITVAQRRLGAYDLGGPGLPALELVTSTEPCAMCFGAIPWSGIRRVVTGARDADARAIGFDEGPKPDDWIAELTERGIAVVTDVQRSAAKAVLDDYLSGGGRIYNSRES